ncbi:MAG TPA: hypothetical protein VGS07_22310 [Thermoanaerobaculia bacterium]|jgi:hypothetical protein|nr:hypothetical protein [Thermoanaerobaculia bacterium]
MRVSITKSIRAGVLTGAIALTLALAPAVARQPEKTRITEPEVIAAQNAWCAALVKIGKVYQEEGKDKAKAVASQAIDALYDYKEGKVFFKPTYTFGKNTFRPTKAGALSYFVAGNQNFPEDDPGFALKPWVTCVADNPNGIQIHGSIAITMGNVSLTSKDGPAKVDKTFVFRKDRNGKLRLCVHHSSVPVAPRPQ